MKEHVQHTLLYTIILVIAATLIIGMAWSIANHQSVYESFDSSFTKVKDATQDFIFPSAPKTHADTSNWAVYTNEAYDFRTKFPNDMRISNDLKTPDSGLLSARLIEPSTEPIIEGSIAINVRSNSDQSNWEQQAGASATDFGTACQGTVCNIKGKKIEWVSQEDKAVYHQLILFEHQGAFYEIHLSVDDQSINKESLVNTFEDITQTWSWLTTSNDQTTNAPQE